MKLLKHILIILIAAVCLTTIPIKPVYAQSRDYTMEGTKRVPIPLTYSFTRAITSIGTTPDGKSFLDAAEDIFINSEGYIFIADTGNDRIVKLTREGKCIGVFKGPDTKPLKKPAGIFADTVGNMYIADTGNKRIVHLSASGEFVEEFKEPDSELLGSNFTFIPTKVCMSPTGYLYIAKGETIMIMDAYNRFRGYLGQNKIEYSLVDVLLRKFASDEQKRMIRKKSAADYTNLTIDEKGMIYATSRDILKGEIKKLNSVGNNIFKTYVDPAPIIMKAINALNFYTKRKLENVPAPFGERSTGDGMPLWPKFVDIAVDKDGIVTVAEEQTGKMYQYDQNGSLLAVFGGLSDQKGSFEMISSLAVDSEGKFYILDRTRNIIQVFEPTHFIKLVHDAINLYNNGEYEKSYELWGQVLSIDENYQLAHAGIAKTMVKQKRYKEAMAECVLAQDRPGYSAAFADYRHELFRQYFVWVILGLIALVFVFILLFKLVRYAVESARKAFREKAQNRTGTVNMLKFSLAVLFDPEDTFQTIKSSRGRLSVVPGIILLILMILVRSIHIFIVHYPLADIDIREANLALEIVKLVLPVVTWVAATNIVTSIIDGESKPDEIFIASVYCQVPYILFTVPTAILSNLLSREEFTLYAVLINCVWLWGLILFFISLRTLNDYSIFKTTVVCIISLLTMALIWSIILLVYVFSGSVFDFVRNVLHEISISFL